MIYFSQHIASFYAPWCVVYPLCLYSIASIAGLFIAMGYYFFYGATVNIPKRTKLAVTHQFGKVSFFKGITNISAFKKFNSRYDFIRQTFFHNRYVLVDNKDTLSHNGIVYNLSVWEDESYITEIGITHNCRCNVVQTAEDATTDKITTQPNPVFEGNVARDEVIFSKKHQFFQLLNTDALAKKNTELMKLNAPYELKYEAKGGAKVSKSIFADKSDQEGNAQSLITIANSLNISSNINPHTFINGRKNPEINIKGVNGDRVQPTSKNIKSGITNAFNDKLKKGMQLREENETFIILDLSNYKNLPNIIDDAISQSWSKFTHYKNIKSLYVEFNQKAILIKKTDKMKYEDFSNDFKKIIKAKSKA